MNDVAKKEILLALSEEMQRIRVRVPTSRWLLFGSIISAKGSIGDIDLLVVAESADDCGDLRMELESICMKLPIHLLLMTRSEEAELDFIDSENAIDMRLRDMPQ